MGANSTDSICALSTAAGRSALAIIRISGPDSFLILQKLLGSQKTPEIRRASLRKLYSKDGELLDEAVVLLFRGPDSFTGEDMVELSVHGNPLVCDRILEDLVSRGTRPAKPGEFSLRACLNGKMSLHELEALDLILNGQTEHAVRAGIRSKLGNFTEKASEIRASLLDLSADIEAQLDFGEAESGEFDPKGLLLSLSSIQSQLEGWLKSYERAQSYLKRLSIALVGRPNVGKSSLFNALVGENRALVHSEPGTTRDYLEVELKWRGRYLLLYDTAGIREGADEVEALGIQKTKEAISRADIVLWVSDTHEEPLDAVRDALKTKEVVRVLSKSDLNKARLEDFISVSSQTGEGIEALKDRILGKRTDEELELSPIVSAREEALLKKALAGLSDLRQSLEAGEYLELSAEKLRELGRTLEEMLGRVPHKELLMNILGRFCIGK